MNPSKNARLIQQFYAACNALANAVNVQLFESLREPYWVANEVGGLCDFEDTDFLTPEEMVLVLQANLTYDEYVEWRDANIKYGEIKGNINLKSWLKGCRFSMIADKPPPPNPQEPMITKLNFTDHTIKSYAIRKLTPPNASV